MVALASLELRVDATQPAQASKTLDSLTASGKRAEAQAGQLAGAQQRLTAETKTTASAFGQLSGAIGALGLVAVGRQALAAADGYTSMQSRLKLATGSTYELVKANERLFAVANGSRVGLEATVDLYTSLQRSTQALGISQERLIGVTETVNRALIVSGASAGAAQAALTQLGQGLASGTLRGDELNSVLEQTPRLAKAIADGMGITVGQLRSLGAEGKITGQAIIAALEGQAGVIAKEFDQMEMTIGQAYQKIQNSTLKYIGDANEAAGVTREIAEAMSFAADNIDVLARGAGVLAGVVGVALFGAVTRYSIATLASTASSIALGAAINGLSVRAAAGAIAMRGLSASMAFFGGPIGLAITAVAGGLAYLAVEASKARAESERLANEMGGTKKALDEYEAAVNDANGKTGEARKKALEHAEALGAEARAAITAASALREKRVALAEAEEAEKAVRSDRRTATIIGALAGAGSGFPTAALAGAIPEAEAERKVATAKSDVEVATKKQAEAQSRYDAILKMLSVPAIDAVTTATDKATASTDRAAEARKRAANEAQDWYRDQINAANDYAASIEREVAAFGKSPVQLKRMEVAAAAAAAPTAELALSIRAAGDQIIGLMEGAERLEWGSEGIKTFWEEVKKAPEATSLLDDFVTSLMEIEDAANAGANAADTLFRSFKNKDWAGVLSGLTGTIRTLQTAFGEDGSFGQQVGAIAGIANMAGNAIGGKAGNALSGASGGMMGGMALAQLGIVGGPFGVIAGGLIGGIAGILGGNKEKERRKNQEAQAKAEAEIARVTQIANQKRDLEIQLLNLQGKELEATKLRREAEVATMDAANRAIQEQIWALEDQAEAAAKAKVITDERADLDIRWMTAIGDAAGALALTRSRERDALSETNRALLDQIYIQEDLALGVANARDALSAAYDREASALRSTKERMDDYVRSFRDFAASLDPVDTNSIGGLDRARREFLAQQSSAATGDEAAMSGLLATAQAFRDASEASAGSLIEHQLNLATIRNGVKAAEAAAANQATMAEKQLAAMDAQVEAALGTKRAVESLAVALGNYQAAIAAQIAAVEQAKQVVNTPPVTSGPANDNTSPAARGPDWASYLAHYSDVAAGYVKEMSSAKGRANLAALGIDTAEQFGAWHWENYGKKENRTPYADGGAFTNSIVRRPTSFDASVMGEAGPEGVLPLANIGGKLGVFAGGRQDSAQLAQIYNELVSMSAALVSIARSTHELNRNFRRAMNEGLYVRGPEPDAPVSTKAAA